MIDCIGILKRYNNSNRFYKFQHMLLSQYNGAKQYMVPVTPKIRLDCLLIPGKAVSQDEIAQ